MYSRLIENVEILHEIDMVDDLKKYSGKLPHGIKGEFDPGIKSLIITLNHVANVSEPKIHEILKNTGVYISTAITDEGTKANDTFMTIVQTAKKLSVSAYDYIFDRVSNIFEMLSLAKLIKEKSSLS